MKLETAEIGIIGGTGLGDVLLREGGGQPVEVDTPFGSPSMNPILANWAGRRVAFIARHGDGHLLNPTRVPYRANIWAMKKLGVHSVLASGATGSLREEIEPGQLVVCDQVIDKTYRRESTFFDDGVAVHVEFADPFCPHLRNVLLEHGDAVDTQIHDSGTYICMEGPQFSTRAESLLHRQWSGDLIGMTCMPEAKLAREAELCYALVGLPTDYDSWRPHDPNQGSQALLQEIMGNLKRATDNAIALVRAVVAEWEDAQRSCHCRNALDLAVWSPRDAIPHDVRSRLELLLGEAEGGS
ncbi:MAG: S-methyl-5'-thioadenosine phosphorylase [Planctomycetota bacterium]|jgi:5'-methylthioadenosine phosphorylase